MHLATGLEFRAVAVMACDDEILPLQERIENVGDDGDLQEVYDTERHLLYVACTRARGRLSISGVEPGSRFIHDLRSEDSLDKRLLPFRIREVRRSTVTALAHPDMDSPALASRGQRLCLWLRTAPMLPPAVARTGRS